MGYDLRPRNEDAGEYHFGAFSFPVLLEACGYYFSAIQVGAQWVTVRPSIDPRMGEGCPMLMTNDGFPVSDEEARVMARIARNFVAIQRTLPNDQPPDQKPWKIRKDFTDRFEQFAEWAEKSGGFEIW